MSIQDSKPDFVDPALKSAARQAWGCERAPAELCRCVERLLNATAVSADASSSNPKGSGFRTARAWFMLPLAAAAMIALGVGVRSLLQSSSAPSSASPSSVAAAASTVLPVSLEAALVASHTHCCHAKNHHRVNAAMDDDAAIARAMQSRLSQAVLVAHPDDRTWEFRGAAICPVGRTRAGHLVFAKGDNAISVYSLPAAMAPDAKDGARFESTADGHPIAAFTRSGGLFCLVASPAAAISVNQLAQMRDHMESAVTAASAPSPSEKRTTVAELLRPEQF